MLGKYTYKKGHFDLLISGNFIYISNIISYDQLNNITIKILSKAYIIPMFSHNVLILVIFRIIRNQNTFMVHFVVLVCYPVMMF